MVRLHLVGFSTDLKNLVFATKKGAKSGGYVVAIDDRLSGTLREVARLVDEQKPTRAKRARPAADPAPPRTGKLTPKEIQGLLRAGKSAAEVAKLAESDTAWIERFEVPILAERTRVVDAVKAGYVSKPRLGPSGVSVGEAILANLRDKAVPGVEEIFDDGWDSRRRRGGVWSVSFRYLSRGRRKEARFEYDAETRTVRAVNAQTADLAWRPAPGGRAAARQSAPASKRARPTKRR
jgi:hypothetical protein